MPNKSRVPAYKLHKPSGHARVIIRGKHVYLGPYGSEESRDAYAKALAEMKVEKADEVQPAAITVVELAARYLEFSERYYRGVDDRPTGQLEIVRHSLRPLRRLYGDAPACEFGPRTLRAVRQAMIDAGLARGVINQRIGVLKRAFKWAASEELLPASVYHSLQTVPGLKAGRTEAKEAAPVGPVADAWVDATLPYLSKTVAAMVELQRLTGMRPGEVCAMRAIDIDTTGPVWTYTPPRHKNAWRGKPRIIPLGPKGQALIRPYLTGDLHARLFQPRVSVQEHAEARRKARKTRVQPSQTDRRRRRPKKQPGGSYDPRTYSHAIRHGITAANKATTRRLEAEGRTASAADLIPHWHANQLRHSYATRVRRMFGLETAQAGLGHATIATTQVYAEKHQELAVRVAQQIG